MADRLRAVSHVFMFIDSFNVERYCYLVTEKAQTQKVKETITNCALDYVCKIQYILNNRLRLFVRLVSDI